jgi:hypothetical protein
MIRITIEMVPKGDEEKAYTLAQGVIVNMVVDENLNRGTYGYGLSGQSKRPGHDPGIKISGVLADFPRKRYDCWELLRRCLNQGDQKIAFRDGTEFRPSETEAKD